MVRRAWTWASRRLQSIAVRRLDRLVEPACACARGVASWTLVSTIAWALAVSYVCTALLSWAYFFAGSGLLATAVAVLLGAGAFRKQMQLVRGAA